MNIIIARSCPLKIVPMHPFANPPVLANIQIYPLAHGIPKMQFLIRGAVYPFQRFQAPTCAPINSLMTACQHRPASQPVWDNFNQEAHAPLTDMGAKVKPSIAPAKQMEVFLSTSARMSPQIIAPVCRLANQVAWVSIHRRQAAHTIAVVPLPTLNALILAQAFSGVFLLVSPLHLLINLVKS